MQAKVGGCAGCGVYPAPQVEGGLYPVDAGVMGGDLRGSGGRPLPVLCLPTRLRRFSRELPRPEAIAYLG